MAKEVLFLVEDADEGGYVARALGYSIFTEADTWDELKRAIRDAVQCHFDEGEQPDLIRLHAIREEVAQHAFDSAIQLARGDHPRVALAALGARGPLIPGESPMGSAWQVAAHRL